MAGLSAMIEIIHHNQIITVSDIAAMTILLTKRWYLLCLSYLNSMFTLTL